MTSKPTIGWIGLGQMGHRMARHVAEAGYPMIVADAASTELAPKKVSHAGSNGEVGAQASVVVLSVPDGAASLAVCRDLIAAQPRAVDLVIDTSTIGMRAARNASDLLRHQWHRLCRRSGFPVALPAAEAGSLSVILGCSKALAERVSPLLSCIGGHLFHVGLEPGMGQAVKLLNNFPIGGPPWLATSEAMGVCNDGRSGHADRARCRQSIDRPEYGEQGQISATRGYGEL